jgi:hypothetical protein
MIVRPSLLRSTLPALLSQTTLTSTRCLHNRIATSPIPSPTPFVPDAPTFLTLIGRDLSKHASKIPSWEALFSLTSSQLRELGIEPPRARRYLLRWREKFRCGEFGVGGDAKFVVDGSAQVRVLEVPRESAAGKDVTTMLGTATMTPGMKKIVVNVPTGAELASLRLENVVPVAGLSVKGGNTITGPWVTQVKGTKGKVAEVKVQEGLWEDRRGHKIDGGERRMAEVRAKRRAEERKAARA